MIKRFLAVLLVLAVLILPASANFIPPGFRYIIVSNYIENVEDFPDYDFISADVRSANSSALPRYYNSWTLSFVTDDGKIQSEGSVFAVPQAAVNKSVPHVGEMTEAEFSTFLESSGAKEVTRGIISSKYIPYLSPQESVTNYYHISPGQTLENPTHTVVAYNDLLNDYIAYLALSVAALTSIIAILVRRRRK